MVPASVPASDAVLLTIIVRRSPLQRQAAPPAFSCLPQTAHMVEQTL